MANYNNSDQEFIDELKKIKLINISHYHLDHHLGIQHFLSMRKKLGLTEKIYLLFPNNLENFYRSYNDQIENLNVHILLHKNISEYDLKSKLPNRKMNYGLNVIFPDKKDLDSD